MAAAWNPAYREQVESLLFRQHRLPHTTRPTLGATLPRPHQEEYARSALAGVARQPPERYGWALLAGHAGVYCAAALVLSAAAGLAQREGRADAAASLQAEAAQSVQQYAALQRLACSSACQEDEVWRGRLQSRGWRERQRRADAGAAACSLPHDTPRALSPLAQVLYGRSGYLLGGLLLNRQLAPGAVPAEALQAVVQAIISSGEWLSGFGGP